MGWKREGSTSKGTFKIVYINAYNEYIKTIKLNYFQVLFWANDFW